MTQWGKKNVVDFYSLNRNKLKDLYDSEKKPLSKIIKKKVTSVVDYGCAVGGFYEILSSFFKKKITYHGLDTENNVIIEAKKKYQNKKNIKFSTIKKGKLKLQNDCASLSFCTGVLNHNNDYKLIINELLRVSSKYSFIDSPRVHLGKEFIGKLNLTKRFPSEILKNNIVNNYTINLKNNLIFLKKVFHKNKIKKVHFFYSNLPYKKKYLKINKKISFLTFLCIKDKNFNKKISYTLLSKNTKIQKLFNQIFG